MKFLAIGDFHYKRHMYITQVSDLEKLLARAAAEKVDFVIHLGDFSNDHVGSQEITDLYLNNPYGLPVYGIYGNHDLESNNWMAYVTPRMTNRPVTRPEGKRIGYWYTDIGNFRLIGLDTNYSLSPEGVWERSHDGSHCPPFENTEWGSLGPDQLAWLDSTIADAARQGRKVLAFSHFPLWDIQNSAPDWAKAQAVFNKYPGTVVASINGHNHTDHFEVINNVVYWDVNTARLGGWRHRNKFHYSRDMEYSFQEYTDGKMADEVQHFPINSMSQAINSWFFEEPLSAVVTVTEDGYFKIEGSKTAWLYEIEPDYEEDGMKPCIEDREVKLW